MAQTKTETAELVDTIANAVVKANQTLTGTVITSKVLTMTADEYREYSKENGTYMGRKEGQKTKLTTEEYGVLMKEPGWSEADIMNKHGLDKDDMNKVKVAYANEQRQR